MARGKSNKAIKFPDDDEAAYKLLIASLEKNHGEGIVSTNISKYPTIERIGTGSIGLDRALSGGWARGRIIELFGKESAGKTTICLHSVAEAQKLGLRVAYIDVENALDLSYAEMLGVDVGRLIFSQPEYGEQAMDVVDTMIRSGAVGLIIIDSVANLTPRAELEGQMSDSVTYDTPIYIRDKISKFIDIIPVAELWGGSKTFYPGHNSQWYYKNKNKEILTHSGWSDIKGIVKKKNIKNKKIICTRTSTGYVKTTQDHSLFIDHREISPKELQVFDRLDVTETPIENPRNIMLNEDIAWLIGFWVAEGSSPRTINCNRFQVCNTEKDLIQKCQNIVNLYCACQTEVKEQINEDKKNLFVLSCSSNQYLGYWIRQSICHKVKYISKGKQRPFLKKVPIEILNGDSLVKRAFLDGFWAGDGSSKGKTKNSRFYHNNSLPVIAGIQYLNTCLGIRTNTVVHPDRPETVTLSENIQNITRKENEILQFYEQSPPEILWDVSTEEGTFVNAIGNIICHNSQMGLQARLMNKALRKFTANAKNTNTTVIFINQMRMKLTGYGDPSTTTGGEGLKYYASQRVDLRRVGSVGSDTDKIGIKTKAKVTKSKCGPPFHVAEFEILFGSGVNREQELIDIGLKNGVIKKNGSWYEFEDQKYQSLDKVMRSNAELCESIEKKVLNEVSASD